LLYNVLRGDVGLIRPPALPSGVELAEDHPLFPYFAGGGRPGLVSWLAIAVRESDDRDAYLRAMERDARMLAGWNVIERRRLLLVARPVLALSATRIAIAR
jgi:hypothetical protein